LASSDIIKEKREGEESLVAVGRIVAAHGLKGEIKAVPLTDSPERIFELRSVFVSRDGAGGADRHEIESVRESGRHLLIKLSGVDDRNRAEFIRTSLPD
jgi:16S rRNA processing protein RimM